MNAVHNSIKVFISNVPSFNDLFCESEALEVVVFEVVLLLVVLWLPLLQLNEMFKPCVVLVVIFCVRGLFKYLRFLPPNFPKTRIAVSPYGTGEGFNRDVKAFIKLWSMFSLFMIGYKNFIFKLSIQNSNVRNANIINSMCKNCKKKEN